MNTTKIYAKQFIVDPITEAYFMLTSDGRVWTMPIGMTPEDIPDDESGWAVLPDGPWVDGFMTKAERAKHEAMVREVFTPVTV